MSSLGDDPLGRIANGSGGTISPVPADFSGVDRILEDVREGTPVKEVSLAGSGAGVIEPPGDGSQTQMIAAVPEENLANNLSFLWHWLKRRFGERQAIPQRRAALAAASQGFLCHSSDDIAGQADGIKLIHPLDDTFD